LLCSGDYLEHSNCLTHRHNFQRLSHYTAP
jgi:hypothetical protein